MTAAIRSIALIATLSACTGQPEGPADISPDDSGADSSEDTAPPELTEIDADTLAAWLAEEAAETRELLLINTHIPYAGEIPGTDEHIAYTNESGLAEAVGDDADRLTVVYCRTGPMSANAASDLVELGYRAIHDLPGGMNAWEDAGYTLED